MARATTATSATRRSSRPTLSGPLHAVGWQHAEPVLRSLALAVLDFGKEQQVNGYALE